MNVNILTKGFLSPTARGWLHPVVKNMKLLQDYGVNLSFFLKNTEDIKFCDVVIVESKYIKDLWLKNKEKIFEFLLSLKTKNNKVFLYDLGDSTYSWVLEALPYIDKLLKPFIFKDKNNYCVPLDGCNLISDYYFKIKKIEPDNQRIPNYISKNDIHLLNKIKVGFNSTFADHSYNSNLWKNGYFNKLTRCSFGIFKRLLGNISNNDFIHPSADRYQNVSCRMSIDGYSNGINFHRKETAKILHQHLHTNKISRKKYINEIRNSKVVVSPFGWGEINVPRDYEVALSGAILLKPDISHIDTWPNIFNADTVVQYKWDLSDLALVTEEILDNYDNYIQFAIRLQEQFRYYSYGQAGKDEFCKNFLNMVKN